MKKSFIILCLIMWVVSAQAQIRLGQSRYTPARPVDILELNYSKPQKYRIAEIKAVGLTTLDEVAIISLSGLRVDDVISIPGDAISTALKRIWGQGIIGDVKILVTKIEGDHLLNKNPQLNVEGLIQTQLCTNAVDLLLVRKKPCQHIRRVATNPVEQEKHQQNHTGQGGNHLPQTAKNISTHGLVLALRFLNVIVNPITQDQGVFAKAFQTLMAKPRCNAC